MKNKGLRVVVIRHPMPYGDLRKQIWERFASYEDLDKYECTIEEREEYEVCETLQLKKEESLIIMDTKTI